MYFAPNAQPSAGFTFPPLALETKSWRPVLLRTQFDFAANKCTPSRVVHWIWSS